MTTMTHDYINVAYDAPMKVGECPLWHPAESRLYWVDIGGFTDPPPPSV